MTLEPTGYRFYGELARWWPLISSPDDYAEEAAYAATVLATARRDVRGVLELGSGGGNNASHLKTRFAMTLVDLSEEMLDISRRLNPECEHYRGDMRTIRLGRDFDAVFVHDAVSYMVTETDLRLAIETAFVHCRPGGIAVFMPDETTEIFARIRAPGDRRLRPRHARDTPPGTVRTRGVVAAHDRGGLRGRTGHRGDHRGPNTPRCVHRPPNVTHQWRLIDLRRGRGRPG